MYETIIDALRRGEHAQALSAARQAVEEAPEDPQSHRWLAAALSAAGQHADAQDCMAKALALAPDDAELHLQQAGMLLAAGVLEGGRKALERSNQLDPNQIRAYVLQAQMALGRGDLPEAERLQKLVARVAPQHAWVKMLQGLVAMQRGELDEAKALVSAAAEEAPDDLQVRYALGFVYMAGGHHAFAEEALRGVVEKAPNAAIGLRVLIAELLRRQGRIDDALQELEPLLADEPTSTAAIRRFAGELQLAAGRPELAQPLLESAFEANQDDAATINALVAAWQANGDIESARSRLDSALSARPTDPRLWRARMYLEPLGTEEAVDVAARWSDAVPDHVPALEMQMAALAARGGGDAADALADRILTLMPGHVQAALRRIDRLQRENPAAAVEFIDELHGTASPGQARHMLLGLRGLALDGAGRYDEAVEAWSAMQAGSASQRLPLPALTSATGPWPEVAEADADASSAAFLVGPPGSRVEQLALLLEGGLRSFRADRFGAAAPNDGWQHPDTPARLLEQGDTATRLLEAWRKLLPSRGIEDGAVTEWLLWWDNAYLHALRPHLPQARVVAVIRDPRDMFLDWLAFGASVPMRIEDRQASAQWLARELEHLAELHQHDLQPHAVVRLDEISQDRRAMRHVLQDALDVTLPEPADRPLPANHLPAGHWRNYAEALAEPFAVLTPVAVRLGYPEA